MKFASDGGYALAQSKLGIMHAKGYGGLKRNDHEAIRLYLLSSIQGCAEGQSNLARHYIIGNFIPQDVAKGIHLYFLASRQGDTFSQAKLSA